MAFNPSTAPIYLYLSQGTRLLSSGDTKVNYSTVALAEDPMDFECRLEIGTVAKVTTKMVPVTGEYDGEKPPVFLLSSLRLQRPVRSNLI